MAIISQSIVGGELYRDRVLRDGAVGYWRLGEASGTAAVDLASTPHNGSYSASGVTLGQAGAIADGDTAVLLNGLLGSMSVADAASLKPTVALSVEAWINLATAQGTGPRIVDKVASDGSGNLGYQIILNATAPFTITSNVFTAPGVVRGIDAVAAAPTGAVLHVVTTYDGQISRVYVNGAQVASHDFGSVATIAHPTNRSLIVGNNQASTGVRGLAGMMDEVAIYPSALTAQQVAAHYGLRLAAVHGGLKMGGAASIHRGVRVTPTGGMLIGGTGTPVSKHPSFCDVRGEYRPTLDVQGQANPTLDVQGQGHSVIDVGGTY